MDVASTNSGSGLRGWLIRLCQWLWRKQKLFWGTFILSVLLNIFASLLLTPLPLYASLKQTAVGWAFQNPSIILFIGSILFFLTCIIGLVSHFSGGLSDRQIKHLYLNYMILAKKTLILKGIPAGLIADGVPLDEVFIPLEFRPNRPLADYPLTEEELAKYRDLQKRGVFSEEMDRVLLDAEKNWHTILKQSDRINIAKLWQRLTREHPVAIIQGFPGIGKSTLLNRLTLHMARCSSGQADPTMSRRLESALIPIFLSLGEYATERATPSGSDLSLREYLKIALVRLPTPIAGLDQFLEQCLRSGRCLVMLDGLDEVSDPVMREKVQEAMNDFIRAQRTVSSGAASFNRFLITSRVAGYDQNAFPDYADAHYTIAELTPTQIEEFLPRWCRANISVRQHRSKEEVTLVGDAAQMAKDLSAAIQDHQGVRELAQNPLLLTLLAVMQQNNIQLPRRRVELYSTVARVLLENRNLVIGLPSIPEKQAIDYLGPIAFSMQATQNSFARQRDVRTALRQTISQEGATPDQVETEVEDFLRRIRERGGLFVIRTGEYSTEYLFLTRDKFLQDRFVGLVLM